MSGPRGECYPECRVDAGREISDKSLPVADAAREENIFLGKASMFFTKKFRQGRTHSSRTTRPDPPTHPDRGRGSDGTHGYRRCTAQLARWGGPVAQEKVRRSAGE